MSKTLISAQSGSAISGVSEPVHPGQYVRDLVLSPKKISVIAAAKLVGVGRPALSNFINGNVAATPDMASRIEVAFGVPAQTLLDMQAAYDAAQSKAKGAPFNAIPYVVPLLSIKATDIEIWASRSISARLRFAVFLRTLVNSTCNGITKIDFPGNDDAERPGWDGYIESTQRSPWVPDGVSGWEFGTNQDIKSKADSDFAKSVKAISKVERDKTTFVFVTPRHWAGKAEWVRVNKAKALWGDVRAYDSSDLEQWLEQSIAAQAWFASETLRPSNGVRSLDKCWTDWAEVASPPLTGSLFAPAIDASRRMMQSRLARTPDESTVIAADSAEEGLAFLAQLFSSAGGSEFENYRDRVLVFDEPGVVPKLAQGTKDFIAVTANRDVERELAPFSRSIQTIVVYPRNAANAEPHVVLEPLNYEAFRLALETMEYGRDSIVRYSNESGRSLTVLRRRLANVPAVRTPEWAADHTTAASLIPFLFVGAWSSTNTADQTVLTLLANVEAYGALEKSCQHLASLNDAPLWSVGTYRGVISKLDLLFAIATSITTQDLQRYFELAKMVLGEDDPGLDLPEEQRWMASFRGKSREFSGSLRSGISETLVLLAVYGNQLFLSRLGFDCQASAGRVVRDLLTPLKTRILEANDRDLAAYAEAAPNEFLSILEDDLQSDHPECYGLMRPAGTGVFEGCARTGLLWALEGLAWSPTTLPRAALVLAQLAGIEIKDNWVNKPVHSLAAIFCAWMPQTAADHQTRMQVIRLLMHKFPKVAWKICMEQIPTGHQTGNYSHKPSWRNEAHGFGEPLKTWGPINSFVREVIDIALNWEEGYTSEMLCDLVGHIQNLSDEHQTKVWSLVASWADGGASDSEKAALREKIRVTVLSRWGAKRSKNADYAKLAEAAKAAAERLEPSDILNKFEWLFRGHWVEESADELHDDDINLRKREERIIKLRTEALQKILDARGLAGIFELAEMGEAAFQIGWLVVEKLLPTESVPHFLLEALSSMEQGKPWVARNLISGALRAFQDEGKREDVLRETKKSVSDLDFARLLMFAPFRRSTWRMVDELDTACREVYWDEIAPDWIHGADAENSEAVERLLEARRPRAAFSCVRYKLETISPELLFRVLSDVAKEGKEKSDHYQLEHYYVVKAFELIDQSPTLTLEQKASLEYVYIDVLSKPWSGGEGKGIPNLERYVDVHPELFIQAIVWTYRRRDEGEDPPEWKIPEEQTQLYAERGHRLLEGLVRIPGRDDLGELHVDKLGKWVGKVRDACATLGRLDLADLSLGKLLANAPSGIDGVWPCEPVRQVMEDVRSKKMTEGMRIGRYNLRGVTWRGEGGGQERELAETYKAWANALQYSHPFLASQLLMGMVAMYEQEATREDAEAAIRRRLR